jgi:hypothetical protein
MTQICPVSFREHISVILGAEVVHNFVSFLQCNVDAWILKGVPSNMFQVLHSSLVTIMLYRCYYYYYAYY